MVVLFYGAGVRFRGVKEWLPAASQLKAQGQEPVFMVDDRCPKEWLERCAQAGVRYRVLPRPSPGEPQRPGGWVLRWMVRGPLASWIDTWAMLNAHLRDAKTWLDEERPSVIVTYTDTFSFEAVALVKIATVRGIPTLVCPLATSPAKAAMESRIESPLYERELSLKPFRNRLIARLCSRWVHDWYGLRMFFFPIQVNALAERLGVLPSAPYSPAGGVATRVAAPSEMDRQIFIEEGVSPDKIVVTGRPYFDTLVRHLALGNAFRERLLHELGIDPSKREKIVVFAVPQRVEYGLWSWEVYQPQLESLLQLFTSLPGVKVVLSLHPGSVPEEYEPLAKRYGAALSRSYDTVALIAICDLLICVYSSIIHLAIGAHKPTVVLAFFDYPMSPFEYRGGVVIVKEREHLRPLLERLISDEAYYLQLARAEAQIAPQWILMDGCCTDRLVEQALSLAASARNAGGFIPQTTVAQPGDLETQLSSEPVGTR